MFVLFRGFLKVAQNQYAEAYKHFNEALKIEPVNFMVSVTFTNAHKAVVAERFRPRTSILEVPCSKPGPAVAPLGNVLYPH